MPLFRDYFERKATFTALSLDIYVEGRFSQLTTRSGNFLQITGAKREFFRNQTNLLHH